MHRDVLSFCHFQPDWESHPYEKGDSRNLINHILNVTLDLIGGGNDGMNDLRSLINLILNVTLDLIVGRD